jgi:hypothetical protein
MPALIPAFLSKVKELNVNIYREIENVLGDEVLPDAKQWKGRRYDRKKRVMLTDSSFLQSKLTEH